MAPRHPDLSQAIWHKSSYSSSTGQNCVEVATNVAEVVVVRDSKCPKDQVLLFANVDWQSFVLGVKTGEW